MHVVGFISELDGNEDHFILADPVIDRNGALFRAVGGTQWTEDDLRALGDRDRRYLSLFKDGYKRAIAEGEAVWLAGSNFVEDLSRLAKLDEVIEQTNTWTLYLRGYRWTLGSPRKYREFNQSLEAALTEYIADALTDPMEKTHGHAGPAFRVFSVLNTGKSKDRELTKALYFFEQKDKFSFELGMSLAIDDGLFGDEEEFWKELGEYRQWIFTPRLSDHPSLSSAATGAARRDAQRLWAAFRQIRQVDAAERSGELKRALEGRAAS